MKAVTVWSFVALGLSLVAVNPPLRSADLDADTAAIRQRVETYVAAYNRRDAEAVANLWAEDAVYVHRDTGQRMVGRPAILKMFQSLFQESTAAQLGVVIDTIRLVTPDVAIEDGTAELTGTQGESEKSSYTAVHVRKGGEWFLDSVRETDTPAPPPADAGPLASLAWLVGEWLDQDEDSTVRTRWEWARNKRFLTSTFQVSVGDQVDLEGTQVIGWDPVASQFRSWVFDSEGGFGEGVWRRVGNQWMVHTTSTLEDGSQGSAVNVYTLVDENTFRWKSVERQVNGEDQPDIEEVSVHRQ